MDISSISDDLVSYFSNRELPSYHDFEEFVQSRYGRKYKLTGDDIDLLYQDVWEMGQPEMDRKAAQGWEKFSKAVGLGKPKPGSDEMSLTASFKPFDKFGKLLNELEGISSVGLGPAQVGGSGAYTLSNSRRKKGAVIDDVTHIKVNLDRKSAQEIYELLGRVL